MVDDFIATRKIYLYGIGRRQKDFEYVLPEIEVHGYISDHAGRKSWLGKDLLTLQEFCKEDRLGKGLIVCERKSDMIESMLTRYQLAYRKDWLWAEDCFDLLEVSSWVREHLHKPVVVWGTGHMAEKFLLAENNEYDIKGFIDNNEFVSEFKGKAVKHPNVNNDWSAYPIIIATYQYPAICEQLLKAGLKENDDFIYFEKAWTISHYINLS